MTASRQTLLINLAKDVILIIYKQNANRKKLMVTIMILKRFHYYLSISFNVEKV